MSSSPFSFSTVLVAILSFHDVLYTLSFPAKVPSLDLAFKPNSKQQTFHYLDQLPFWRPNPE